jgi:tRNA threonylcarbamoyladenosine biosynthesis protein TsaB
MIILALDCCLDACSAAITTNGRVLARRIEPMTRGQAERLAPLVAETMEEAALSFPALDRIAVTTGPGSFTGLRVGLAFARGLALALGKPCVGLSSLEVLASGEGAALIETPGAFYCGAFGEDPVAPRAVEDEAAVRAAFGARNFVRYAPGSPTPDPVVLARLAAVREPAAHPPRPLYLRAADAKPQP